MLEEMRQHSHSWIIYVLFGILIAVFAINFGPGSRGCQGGGSPNVATVNGNPIPNRDFERVYRRYYNYLSSVYPGFDAKKAESMNLRQSVLDDLINQELLVQEATKRGLVINDDELKYAIVNDPQFQKDGHFDKEYYQLFVTRYNGMSIPRFEDQKRRELLASKMEELFKDAVMVSEQEMVNKYKLQNDKLRASFVTFRAANHLTLGSSIADDEAQKVLDAEYDAAETYYKNNKFRYRGKRRVSVSRILIPVEEEAAEEAMAAAIAKTKEIRAKLAAGGDFAALAKEFSKGAEAEKGGAMGFLDDENLENFPILRAVAAVEVGKVVDNDVVTKDGLNIVKVDELDISKDKPFEEIKLDVTKDMLADRKAREGAKAEAEAWIAKALDGTSLSAIVAESEDAATEGRPYAESTEWLTRDAKAITGLGIAPELVSALFAEQSINHVINKAIPVGNSYVAAWILDRQAPNMGEYDENRDLIKGSLREDKRRQTNSAWLKELRENAKIHIYNGRAASQDLENY